MLTNTFVTIVQMKKINRENTYKVMGTYPAHFEETKGINTSRSSRERSDVDKVAVYIPEVLRDVKAEDIIIRNPEQKEIKELRAFKDYEKEYDAFLITSSDVYDFGSDFMQHTMIGGK